MVPRRNMGHVSQSADNSRRNIFLGYSHVNMLLRLFFSIPYVPTRLAKIAHCFTDDAADFMQNLLREIGLRSERGTFAICFYFDYKARQLDGR